MRVRVALAGQSRLARCYRRGTGAGKFRFSAEIIIKRIECLSDKEINRVFLAGIRASEHIGRIRARRTLGTSRERAELGGRPLDSKLLFKNSCIAAAEARAQVSVVLKIEVNVDFFSEALAPALPGIIDVRRIIKVPTDQPSFRFWFRVVTKIGAFVVGVGLSGEANICPVIASPAVTVSAVIEMPAIFVVAECVSQAVTGAIEAARSAAVVARRGNRRRVEIGAGIRKAMSRGRAEDLKIESRSLFLLPLK